MEHTFPVITHTTVMTVYPRCARARTHTCSMSCCLDSLKSFEFLVFKIKYTRVHFLCPQNMQQNNVHFCDSEQFLGVCITYTSAVTPCYCYPLNREGGRQGGGHSYRLPGVRGSIRNACKWLLHVLWTQTANVYNVLQVRAKFPIQKRPRKWYGRRILRNVKSFR